MSLVICGRTLETQAAAYKDSFCVAAASPEISTPRSLLASREKNAGSLFHFRRAPVNDGREKWRGRLAIYRASPKQGGVAWVTGASTGIGRALALALARQGYAVAATARSEDRLASLSDEAEAFPGRIVPFAGDVTDEPAMQRIVADIEEELGPITLAVLNAGAYFPARGDALDAGNFVKTYEINVLGVIYSLVPVIERMDRRGFGHVAIIGSASAYGGLPMAAAYGASKAALNNMAESLKFDFDRMNIRIQVINPGFIKTPLTAKSKFPMPGLMGVDEAVKRIVAGLESGGFEVSFPRRFTWWLKLISLLPHPLYFALINQAMGRRKRPLPRKKSRGG